MFILEKNAYENFIRNGWERRQGRIENNEAHLHLLGNSSHKLNKIMGILINDQSMMDIRRRKQGTSVRHPLDIIDANANKVIIDGEQCKRKKLSWFRKYSTESHSGSTSRKSSTNTIKSADNLRKNSDEFNGHAKCERKSTTSSTISSPALPPFFKEFTEELEMLKKFDSSDEEPLKLSNNLTNNQVSGEIIFKHLINIVPDFDKAYTGDLVQTVPSEINDSFDKSSYKSFPIKFERRLLRSLDKIDQTPKTDSLLSPYSNSLRLSHERHSVPLNFIPGVTNIERSNKTQRKQSSCTSIHFVEQATFCFKGVNCRIYKNTSKTYKALAHAACMGLVIPAPSSHKCSQ